MRDVVAMGRGFFAMLLACAPASFPAAAQGPAEVSPPALRLLELGRPLVIGHRGFSQVAPENTLPAFRLAMAAGADLVELDYFHSSDGVPVVIHDRTLDRTTDAVRRWGREGVKIEEKTAADLQGLDAGSWFDPQFAGLRIPLLAETLDTIQRGGVSLIERKAGDAATCVNLLRERDLINQVVVQAFDWNYLGEFHSLAPDQVLGALGPPRLKEGRELTDAEKQLDAAWLDQIGKTGARVVGWNRSVTPASIQLVHDRGLKIWIYTVNDPEVADELLDAGADGIITDNPALIWKAMALREH